MHLRAAHWNERRFHDSVDASGHHLTVGVHLRSTPAGDTKALAAKVEAIVRAHFGVPAARVDVTF